MTYLDEIIAVRWAVMSRRRSYDNNDDLYVPGDVFPIIRSTHTEEDDALDALAALKLNKPKSYSPYDMAPNVDYWVERQELRHKITTEWITVK
jgi:hypothetical protein